MSIFIIILSGIVATLCMTGFVYLLAFITQKRLKVIHVLGTMMTGETTPDKGLSQSGLAYAVGLVLHYLIGIGFVFLFTFLCFLQLAEPTFFCSFVFGVCAGLFAICVWGIYIKYHPHPPLLPIRLYLLVIGMGHVVFGIVMWWTLTNRGI